MKRTNIWEAQGLSLLIREGIPTFLFLSVVHTRYSRTASFLLCLFPIVLCTVNSQLPTGDSLLCYGCRCVVFLVNEHDYVRTCVLLNMATFRCKHVVTKEPKVRNRRGWHQETTLRSLIVHTITTFIYKLTDCLIKEEKRNKKIKKCLLKI